MKDGRFMTPNPGSRPSFDGSNACKRRWVSVLQFEFDAKKIKCNNQWVVSGSMTCKSPSLAS